MYALVIVIGVLSSAIPVGVTSQTVGKFESLDKCKAAGSEPQAGGTVSDLNLSRGVYWYCIYTGEK